MMNFVGIETSRAWPNFRDYSRGTEKNLIRISSDYEIGRACRTHGGEEESI
jgi:hypothetical protein